NGHGAKTTGNGRYHRRDLFNAAFVDVAGPDVTPFLEILPSAGIVAKQTLNLGAVGNLIGPDVNHNGAGLHPIARYHRGFADRGDDDVCLTYNLRKIAGFR